MVRLKDPELPIEPLPYPHFNSSMVRLKVDGYFCVGHRAAKFQFQYGAIKSPVCFHE